MEEWNGSCQCLCLLLNLSIKWIHNMKSVVYLNKLPVAGPQNLLCCVVLFYVVVYVYVQKMTHLYMVLPKSPRNRNAAQKLLVVELCAARYHELYPLWSILPSGVLLWGRMCFLCAFLWRCVSAVLWSDRPAKMTDVKEQRICIKFGFKLGKMASETRIMLKEALGDNALGQMQTYEWFKHFKNGQMSMIKSILDDLRPEPRPKMWQ